MVGNKIADHWSIAFRLYSNYTFILDLTSGLIILRKDNCKARGVTFKLSDLVRLILKIWRSGGSLQNVGQLMNRV